MERWITRLSLPLRQVIRQRCSIMHRLQEPAIGEYFRDTGRHALVVYDDLSSRQLLIGKYR